jgi:integrase
MSLKLVRRPRSPFWIIRGSVRGRSIEETTGTADRRLAEGLRAKREAELFEEVVHGRRAAVSFAEAALSYVEAGGAQRFLGPVVDHFRLTPLDKVDQEVIEKGARKVYPTASPATRVRQFFTPTAAVLHHAAKRGWCERPVIERPAIAASPFHWLTQPEAERLIASCSDHLRPLVVFLLFTGARSGEALSLDWREVDLVRGHVAFLDTKNGESRGMPLHRRVVAELANLPHRSGAVFRKPGGEAYVLPRGGEDTSAGGRIKKAFAGACRRAGIEGFHPHGCRHTWATWHYQANRDLTALMRLGGWKSVSMVLRYAHVNVGELKHTIDRLSDGFGPSQTWGPAGDSGADDEKTA